MRVLEIFLLCLRTSLISFGGVYGALPEYVRVFVTERHWLSLDEVMESYVVGQVVPGPNLVLGVMLGYRTAGAAGACAAFAGTYAPSASIMSVLATVFARYRHVSWVRRSELGLRPLVIGLMLAAVATIVRVQITQRGFAPTVVVLGLLAVAYLRRLLAPLPLLFAAGFLFWAVAGAFAALGQ